MKSLSLSLSHSLFLLHMPTLSLSLCHCPCVCMYFSVHVLNQKVDSYKYSSNYCNNPLLKVFYITHLKYMYDSDMYMYIFTQQPITLLVRVVYDCTCMRSHSRVI